VALANLVHGVPIDSKGDYAGDFLDLFSGYTVLGGVAVVSLFALHGANYLGIRTSGELCERAMSAARRLSVPAIVLGAGFLVWTVAVAHDRNQRGIVPVAIPAAIGILALLVAALLLARRRSGYAFVFGALAVLAVVATIFTGLYPRVLVSHPTFANSLTIAGAASEHYALVVMTVVAGIFTPLVLLYQGWTYRVFRRRLGGEPASPTA
jgi:cytochrome d ubiquinol oxidase subunit II